jgi:hypothetical protein
LRRRINNPSDEEETIEDLEFDNLKEQAKKEVRETYARLLYRNKYNLPPNDPRFLDMTDEEIVYELVLANEFSDFLKSRSSNDSDAPKEIFESDKKQFDTVTKQLEDGEDIDLMSLLPKQSWEKI